jgi:phosphoglycerol transferase
VEAAFPLDPVLALACLRACGAGGTPQTRGERGFLLAACVAQGLCFLPYSLFAAWLLLAGAAIGWLRTRSRDRLRLAALGVVLLALGAGIAVVPSALYRARHGRNEALLYKAPAVADQAGLRLRQLLTPIDDHPLPPLREAAARIGRAAFPGERESARTRIGTLGTVGLLFLLGFALARGAGVAAPDDAVGSASALTLVALLVAQVGGLGSLFGVLVVSDVRGYGRIAVFVAFLALHAAAVLVGRLLQSLPDGTPGSVLRAVALVLLGAAALGDQRPRAFLATTRWSSAPAFDEDAAFVARLEATLPEGAMVFQLPHATVPLDLGSRPALEKHDPGRAYLHSRTLRWSWGSVPGRGDWQAETSRLPPAALARRVAAAGFEGIWLDRWAYPAAGPRPWPALEGALAAETGSPPIVSSGGRYSFLRLDALRRQLGPADRAVALRVQPAVYPRWQAGCSDEQGEVREPSRVCGPAAWALVENDSPAERHLVLTARLRALRPGLLRLEAGGTRDELRLAGETLPYRRELALGPRQALRLELAFDGPCEATSPRARCVEILDMKASPAEADQTAAP